MKALNTHSDIKCYDEPFFRKRWEERRQEPWNVHNIKDLHGPEQLYLALDGLLSQYSGLKHVESALSREQNKRLLTEFGLKVVFLWRKNSLKWAISNALSIQSKVWHVWGRTREQHSSHEFQAIEISKLHNAIKYYKKSLDWYKWNMNLHDVPYYELAYEQFLEKDIKPAEKLSEVNNVLKYLGYKGLDKIEDVENLGQVLDYEKNRLNSKDIYEKIPNIKQIRAALENEKNGLLF